MATTGPEYLQSQTKRRLDVIGGLACGAILLPVGASAAVASVIDCKDLNPLFQQERIGQRGVPFNIFKIRTLRRALMSADVEVFGTFDPRASKLGVALREYGIDEVPQIYNVLSGEMSLIGIRPILDASIEENRAADPKLFDDWYDAYRVGRPGMLGPGQIYRHRYRGHTPEVLRESMRLDIDYVENASLVGDLKLLATGPIALHQANRQIIENIVAA